MFLMNSLVKKVEMNDSKQIMVINKMCLAIQYKIRITTHNHQKVIKIHHHGDKILIAIFINPKVQKLK